MVDGREALRADPAEISVIGAMLIDDRTVPIVMQALSPEDFADGDMRHIFEAIQGIFLARGRVDSTTVLSRLDAAGYREKLFAVMDLTPTAAGVEDYARILRERRQLREIQAACMRIVNEGTDLPTARELLAGAAGLLARAQPGRDKSYSELMMELLGRQNDSRPPDHLDWGIEALNTQLRTGPGRFIILGADSSVGKTALALQFALSMARSGKSVGFFSYETGLADLADRLAANDADLSLPRLKAKALTPAEIKRLVDTGNTSDGVPLRVIECARYTVDSLRAKTIAHGFQVVFVDYVQLIPTRKKDRYEAVTDISIGLHALAQELGVTVVGLSQVTVPETDKRGKRRYISTNDLRESRQLKQDADVILLMDLVDPTDRAGHRILQVAKNRDGALGRIVLDFDPYRMRFAYVPPVEDSDEARGRERAGKMDRNREARKEGFKDMDEDYEQEALPF